MRQFGWRKESASADFHELRRGFIPAELRHVRCVFLALIRRLEVQQHVPTCVFNALIRRAEALPQYIEVG